MSERINSKRMKILKEERLCFVLFVVVEIFFRLKKKKEKNW